MSAEIKDLSPKHVWVYFYDLTQIPRPTGHMEAVTRFMISFGKGLGLETLQDEVGNVLIRKPATPGMEGRKTVTLQSHLDMVPQKNSSVKHDFEKDPIDAYIDGDWVTARETTLGADNGMGAALAMAVLADNSLRHGPIEALFTIDEEQGMDGAFGLKPHFLKGDILLNCDSEKEGELFVGCAGGANVNVSFQFKEDTYIPEGDVAVKVSLAGLKGGHSGVDIHLGRANANKLIFRFLKEAVCDYGARLSSVAGGSLPNAIPREAFAVITIPGDNVESLWELVADYQDMFRTEYMGVEDQIDFVAEMVELPSTLIPEEIQDDLINAIEGCQNGVISMLHDFPGTVESSSNLAIVKTSDELIEVKILVRSSSESRRDSVCSSLESVFALAGAKVEESGHYNGWQPNINSPILNLMKSTYLDLFGKEPEVKVMHAGLECGIIQGAYPDMDMVPRTFIFGAKAAPAYVIAKDIIHLLLTLQDLIKDDPEVAPYMKLVMVENYNVSAAEKLFPACDISEQISLASKEASGTGNMKFMLNGAVTLGTMDGANVEISELVGEDNIYIFGESSEKVIEHYEKADYCSRDIYENDKHIKECVDFIVSEKMLALGHKENLERLHHELVSKDWFMTLLDFNDYVEKKDQALADYADRKTWAKKMLVNIAKAGFFSSDRTIEQYNNDIWHLTPAK